jgi:hypothetical protein
MLLLLIVCIIVALILPLLSTDYIWYDKKNGLKYTLTDRSITTEWDYKSPLTLLRLLHLALQCERNPEQRNKFIKQYNRLKKSLENDGYDVSTFKDYEIK